MGFAKPIEQYLFSNLFNLDTYILYLKDIIRGRNTMKDFKGTKNVLPHRERTQRIYSGQSNG